MKSSIGIFTQSVDQQTVSETPAEVFEAAERVADSRIDEIIRHRTGIYLVQYSDTGPFQNKMPAWLPVKITKVIKWVSGGIKEAELQQFKQGE